MDLMKKSYVTSKRNHQNKFNSEFYLSALSSAAPFCRFIFYFILLFYFCSGIFHSYFYASRNYRLAKSKTTSQWEIALFTSRKYQRNAVRQ